MKGDPNGIWPLFSHLVTCLGGKRAILKSNTKVRAKQEKSRKEYYLVNRIVSKETASFGLFLITREH